MMGSAMIGGEYCRVMARYNAWQNSQLFGFLGAMPPEELTRDRGAFFGSILGTVNHILWGDCMWMSRFDGGAAPRVSGVEGPGMHADLTGWQGERVDMDARISDWVSGLKDQDLAQHLTWYSGVLGRETGNQLGLCVVGFFNHQTHHRGQVHAMLTAAGSKAPVSDLFLLPEAG